MVKKYYITEYDVNNNETLKVFYDCEKCYQKKLQDQFNRQEKEILFRELEEEASNG